MWCTEEEGSDPALLGDPCPADWNALGQESFVEGLVHEILETWHVFCKQWWFVRFPVSSLPNVLRI